MAAMWMVAMLACCGAASGQSWLANISLNLRTEMQGVLEMAVVNYSQPDINTTYVASVEFDMRAMGPLYNSSHLVIDFIADKQAYPADFVKVSGGHIDIESPREKWRELLAHYAGPVGVVVVAALLVIALPLAGLLWCCCYWCRGGRRRRPFDRKYDVCLKGILAILLIGLITLFLFGVVCAFATDSQLEDGLRGAGGAVQRGSRDARAFLNATQAHARHLLVHNYGELERRLQAILTSSGLTVSLQLGEFSRGASLGALQRVVARLDGVAARLQTVRLLTARLRRHAENLNTGLRKVRSHLLQTLATCAQPDCVRLQEKYSIGQLDTDIQYSQIPDVTELLANVTAILNSTIKEDVAEGQKVFKNIQLGIQRSVDEHIPSVQDAITQTGHKLRSVADEITAAAGNASARLERVHAGEAIDSLHRQYGAYRRHAGRAVAAALLLITCLLVWGLTCGVCGKRPDQYYTHDCCNKGSGARGLLCAMGVMFVVGGAAALALLVYFVCGVAAQRFLCEPLTEPRNNRLFDDLEQLVEFEQLMFNERRDADFNMSAVLVRCHSNMTIYETLSLHRLYDLPSLRAQAGAALAERVARVRVALPARAPVRLLAGRARARLRALQAAGLEHFRGDALLQALETNMTKLDLDGLIEQTSKAAHNVSLKEGYERVGAALQQAVQQLRRQETDSLQPLRADTRELQRIATELQDELRFNQSSMKDAIDYLLHETQQAESFLNTQGAALVQNITLDLGEVVASMLGDYLDMVVRAAREDVGRCGPLSNAFNATRDAACQQILMPANGYWISLAWCLVLLAPLLALAPRLAALYRRPEPYPGPLVEAEYLYDAYADRDNVPLANAYKAEKRSGGGRGAARRGGGAGSGAGGGAGRSAEVAPPVDAHHARRYNDMAPKHWEEGPPRYHGPTEYERPPPYYYPGPADRQ